MHTSSRPIRGLSALRSANDLELLRDYEKELVSAGYCPQGVRFHLQSVVHFLVWLPRWDGALERVDERTVTAFELHRPLCRCPGASRNRERRVLGCVRVFLRRLREHGICPSAGAVPPPHPLTAEFLHWMKVHRGIADETLRHYRTYVGALVAFLGEDPRTYTARGLREFVAKRYGHYGPNPLRMVLAAARMFLRFLAAQGRCRAGLDQALLSPACWAKQALPRGLSGDDVEKVLALCPPNSTGIRDRAILLLMVRLGLRAGDVAALRLGDLCFETASVRVLGKGRREARLPIPQDVGEALLAYLRSGRPRTRLDRVFLPVKAPCAPGHGLGSAAVGQVARTALERAGIRRPARGSHVFRHTAACQMLRGGVGLEGIAEVLRHRSVGTTGIYAKVDVQALAEIALPWPEVQPC